MSSDSFGSKADNLQRLLENDFNVPKFYVVPAKTKTDLADQGKRSNLTDTFDKWRKGSNVSVVAVRSSSTQEDTKENSFAGQFTTVLDVSSSEAYLSALKAVFSSKQRKAYSTKTGVVHAIVQEFIEPDISGVIFSVNPASDTNELVINAA